MSTATFPTLLDRRESLRETLLLSMALHGALFLLAIAYSVIGPRFGGGWGKNWGAGGAARINAVTSLPGVPLPAPVATTQSTLATQNPGLYQTEVKTELVPPKEEIQVPKFQKETQPEKAVRVAKRIQKEPLEVPDNAIPFGLGGRPAMSYQQFANSAGSGGLEFGDGNFGDRYGWYVSGVRSRISSNWLLSTVSPSIATAPRVVMQFAIARDGTISNAQVVQSSGIPEVDRSALRAVLASNPLGPLPNDYPGSKVSVEFYFDFHRR